MIYNLNLNPSLDYHIYKNDIKNGEVNRITDANITFGGKGLNVSYALKILKTESVALGFLGGFSGKEIKRLLDEKNIRNKFIDISPETSRINVKIHSELDTDLNAPGPNPQKKHISSLLNLLSLLKEQDILCLCGTAADKESYKRILSAIPENVKLIADADGEFLKEAVEYKPFLIKPNSFELLDLFSSDDPSEENLIRLGLKLKEKGIKYVLISRGEKGLLLLGGSGVYKAEGISGNAVNTVGAGDFSLAGFISECFNSFDEVSALKSALSASAARVFTKDEPNYFDMRKYANIAKITKLK